MHKGQINSFSCNEHDLSSIKECQLFILEMAKEVCGILEEFDIPYMISFGTLLGAVRHKGFIPWDDDFDIFIIDEAYDQAIYLLKNKLTSNLVVHNEKNDPLYFKSWSTVKNLNTKCILRSQYNIDNALLKYPALSIDLYRLKNINEQDAGTYKALEAKKFFKKKRDLGIISENQYCKEVAQFKKNYSYSLKDKDHWFFIFGLKSPIHSKDIFPLSRLKFEDHFFYAPRNPHVVLVSHYGNYMKIPEPENRKGHIIKTVFSNKNIHD